MAWPRPFSLAGTVEAQTTVAPPHATPVMFLPFSAATRVGDVRWLVSPKAGRGGEGDMGNEPKDSYAWNPIYTSIAKRCRH